VSVRDDVKRALFDYPDVRESTMFGGPAFFVGRRLVACVSGERVALKTDGDLAASLLNDGIAVDFEPKPNPGLQGWIAVRLRDLDAETTSSLFRGAVELASKREKPPKKKLPKT